MHILPFIPGALAFSSSAPGGWIRGLPDVSVRLVHLCTLTPSKKPVLVPSTRPSSSWSCSALLGTTERPRTDQLRNYRPDISSVQSTKSPPYTRTNELDALSFFRLLTDSPEALKTVLPTFYEFWILELIFDGRPGSRPGA